jgi:hypothetical protein
MMLLSECGDAPARGYIDIRNEIDELAMLAHNVCTTIRRQLFVDGAIGPAASMKGSVSVGQEAAS